MKVYLNVASLLKWWHPLKRNMWETYWRIAQQAGYDGLMVQPMRQLRAKVPAHVKIGVLKGASNTGTLRGLILYGGGWKAAGHMRRLRRALPENHGIELTDMPDLRLVFEIQPWPKAQGLVKLLGPVAIDLLWFQRSWLERAKEVGAIYPSSEPAELLESIAPRNIKLVKFHIPRSDLAWILMGRYSHMEIYRGAQILNNHLGHWSLSLPLVVETTPDLFLWETTQQTISRFNQIREAVLDIWTG